jgi:hypothetical protein
MLAGNASRDLTNTPITVVDNALVGSPLRTFSAEQLPRRTIRACHFLAALAGPVILEVLARS